jgi:SnoaL-like domain
MKQETKQSTWETYLEAWADTDVHHQSKVLSETFDPSGVYINPLAQAVGHEQLLEVIRSFQDAYRGPRVPTTSFKTTSFLEHHDVAAVFWNMPDTYGELVLAGCSFLQFGADGRITNVSTFVDPKYLPT